MDSLQCILRRWICSSRYTSIHSAQSHRGKKEPSGGRAIGEASLDLIEHGMQYLAHRNSLYFQVNFSSFLPIFSCIVSAVFFLLRSFTIFCWLFSVPGHSGFFYSLRLVRAHYITVVTGDFSDGYSDVICRLKFCDFFRFSPFSSFHSWFHSSFHV